MAPGATAVGPTGLGTTGMGATGLGAGGIGMQGTQLGATTGAGLAGAPSTTALPGIARVVGFVRLYSTQVMGQQGMVGYNQYERLSLVEQAGIAGHLGPAVSGWLERASLTTAAHMHVHADRQLEAEASFVTPLPGIDISKL